MFGMDNNEKELKELLAQLGCEASVFKNFKPGYEKMEKYYPQCCQNYLEAGKAGTMMLQLLEALEKGFVEKQSIDYSAYTKQLKQLQNRANHEFIVSSNDSEFHSTYDNLIKKLPELAKHADNRLFMQSEVENLISMLKERLAHKRPDLHAYAYFLIAHKDAELQDLSNENKCEYILNLYRKELILPVIEKLQNAEGHPSFARLAQVFEEMTGVKA